MHEISLVRSIFQTLESEFSEEEVELITAIDLKVGLLSNIQPILMQNAFEAVTSVEKKFDGARLNIEVVPIEIYCETCASSSSVDNYKFVCQQCGQPNNNITRGTELLIHRVHFAEATTNM
jgi:hydrogenase nickel incorporation protein HypA/HybF